ncbi:phage holin [Agathobaculum sp. Marseille-P7918]|uniref:phage holin n=1 Tax=Agathobaculum sp. Marseille-P7918 TaxID=2479843 RepID=UPI000F642218|nr:phage holin [Agathobaculum sp. Marseille-P7918]
MNLRVRIKNPVFWVQLLLGVFATLLAYAGLTAADMTSWGAVWDVARQALTNPYCLFLVASNVWNALNDPTTSGLTDSDRARQYEKPLEK